MYVMPTAYERRRFLYTALSTDSGISDALSDL
jgi:hypothetical protein